jgi:hypothetical protein
MSKHVNARDIARTLTLVEHMKFEKNSATLVDCWWNRMIRKYVKHKLGVEPEYIVWRMIANEIKRRGTDVT